MGESEPQPTTIMFDFYSNVEPYTRNTEADPPQQNNTHVGFCVRPVLAHAESAAAARLSEGGLRPTSFGNPSVLAGRSRPRRGVRSGRRVERSRGRLASAR